MCPAAFTYLSSVGVLLEISDNLGATVFEDILG